MARWLPRVLKRIHELAAADRVRLTFKAAHEALSLGLVPEEVCDVIGGLSAGESAGRLASKATREWLYVFKPEVAGQVLYVKLVLRDDCVIVSFHEDEGAGHEEAGA